MTTTSTGGWTTYAQRSITIIGATGNQDLYLTFAKAGSPDTCSRIDWMQIMDNLKNPYKLIQAESYDAQVGTTNSSGIISDCNTNDYLKYSNVYCGDGSGAKMLFNIGVASAVAGAKIKIRQDSNTGTLVGTLTTVSTGAYTTYAIQSVNLSATSGIHDLYIVFDQNGKTGSVCNLDYFSQTPFIIKNAKSQINGVDYDLPSSGVTAWGTLGSCDQGEWVKYTNVNFSSVTGFQANISVDPSCAGGYIEVRLGSPTGTRVANLLCTNTGGWTIFNTQSTTCSVVNGTYDVYICFTRSGTCGLNWFKFT
jgi:hypothetical protein